jgi:hypothetical protein
LAVDPEQGAKTSIAFVLPFPSDAPQEAIYSVRAPLPPQKESLITDHFFDKFGVNPGIVWQALRGKNRRRRER